MLIANIKESICFETEHVIQNENMSQESIHTEM